MNVLGIVIIITILFPKGAAEWLSIFERHLTKARKDS